MVYILTLQEVNYILLCQQITQAVLFIRINRRICMNDSNKSFTLKLRHTLAGCCITNEQRASFSVLIFIVAESFYREY